MKHVVAINGSSKNANTHRLISEIANVLAVHQIHVTVINLGDYKIDDCIGCELCIRKTSSCFQKGGAQTILSKLVEADGIILASPVYLMHITGKLKSLIDKTASWVHRPPMVGKPALVVATTAGSADGIEAKQLSQSIAVDGETVSWVSIYVVDSSTLTVSCIVNDCSATEYPTEMGIGVTLTKQ
jgi:multimeric flavodoxin WrbA